MEILNPPKGSYSINNKKEHYEFLGKLMNFFVLNDSKYSYSKNGIKYFGWAGQKILNILNGKIASLFDLKSPPIVKVKMREILNYFRNNKLWEPDIKYSQEYFVCSDQNSNLINNWCNHIRNSLAHGLFGIFLNENDEEYVWFQNKGNKNKINMRGIIKKSNLLKIIDIIETGYKE
ncbi:MAG: hypothetical protein KA885_01545 [Spirochaetes bacterium]|nr:hypothetical protein [Spirochaetota bacterium]